MDCIFFPMGWDLSTRWWWLWRNANWQGKPKYSEKTCPSATLSTTNTTWPDPGSNPGRHGGKPATNRLSYGTASIDCKLNNIHSFINGSMALLLGPGLFFSFVIFFTQTVGLLGRVVSPSQGRYLYTGQHKHRINAETNIHVLNGIRNYDPRVRASEDSSCLRPRGHCDRQIIVISLQYLYRKMNITDCSVRQAEARTEVHHSLLYSTFPDASHLGNTDVRTKCDVSQCLHVLFHRLGNFWPRWRHTSPETNAMSKPV
jgi:hypothetical protein